MLSGNLMKNLNQAKEIETVMGRIAIFNTVVTKVFIKSVIFE